MNHGFVSKHTTEQKVLEKLNAMGIWESCLMCLLCLSRTPNEGVAETIKKSNALQISRPRKEPSKATIFL